MDLDAVLADQRDRRLQTPRLVDGARADADETQPVQGDDGR
jgi:hypothetical protein